MDVYDCGDSVEWYWQGKVEDLIVFFSTGLTSSYETRIRYGLFKKLVVTQLVKKLSVFMVGLTAGFCCVLFWSVFWTDLVQSLTSYLFNIPFDITWYPRAKLMFSLEALQLKFVCIFTSHARCVFHPNLPWFPLFTTIWWSLVSYVVYHHFIVMQFIEPSVVCNLLGPNVLFKNTVFRHLPSVLFRLNEKPDFTNIYKDRWTYSFVCFNLCSFSNETRT